MIKSFLTWVAVLGILWTITFTLSHAWHYGQEAVYTKEYN